MARTVALGTITQALIDKQNSSGRVPHIRIFINGVDYTSRLLYLEHHEEAYRDRAVIGLSNRDNFLDSLDIDGKEFEIAYGYITGNAVAEPLGNNDTAEYVYTPTLWVKSHQIISIQGERIYQIYAEGMWMYLRERKVIAGLNIWQASRTYIVGEATGSVTPNGHRFLVTTAGTSGGTEPTWDTASGATTTDGTVTWTAQEDLDYSNYPMVPLHDWDITPDGKLFLNSCYTAGYKLMIVGIKPLAFTGSGASETIALDSP
ncbi:hypothetical protein LCGC14_2607650, partial [marine sediment metagenome]